MKDTENTKNFLKNKMVKEDKMLRSIKEIIGYTMKAKDGDIGKVVDFYFDDEKWTIRYLIADTGNWLSGRRVLIAPAAFYDKPDWASKEFPLVLTKEMIKGSPDIDTKRPVSRQKEMDLFVYYNWPIYWRANPIDPVPPDLVREQHEKLATETNPHLRSSQEIFKYGIMSNDGEIGHVADLIISDDDWVIRYLVVDTGSWLPGKKVLIAPDWIKGVSWAESKVHIALLKEKIKDSPTYNPSEPVNRGHEEKLYDYYGRPKYW
jgi:hypothetical protein